MKKLLQLFLSCIILLTGTRVQAQATVGVLAGTNLSFGYIDMANAVLATDHIGVRAGITSDLPLSDAFSAQLGVMYASFGFTYTIARMRADAIEVPITFAYKIGKPGRNRFVLGAGGCYTGIAAATVRVIGGYSGTPQDYTRYTSRSYFSPVASLTYQLTNGLFIRTSFQPGLKQLVVPYYDFNAWYNAETSICIGYYFNFRNTRQAVDNK